MRENQLEILKLKNTASESKNFMDGFKNKLDTGVVTICQLEDMPEYP